MPCCIRSCRDLFRVGKLRTMPLFRRSQVEWSRRYLTATGNTCTRTTNEFFRLRDKFFVFQQSR
jgi:hypothetical protein